MSSLKSLEINGWRQFQKVKVDFHPTLTVLTGANGAGKTTILNLLNRHYGWNVHFIATPEKNAEDGNLNYLTGLWDRVFGKLREKTNEFGRLMYGDGVMATLTMASKHSGTQFQPQINGMKTLHGLHIPSHRPVFNYQHIGHLPTSPPSRTAIINTNKGNLIGASQGGGSSQVVSHLKQTLIALALFGEGNKYVTPDPLSLKLFEGFQDILGRMLPSELGFQGLHIENPEVILRTKSGNFTLDAVSGGIGSILDLSWQIYMCVEKEKAGVVTIDEPENHLHPKLQRKLLPNLIEAFPKMQFIVVTHNPMVVTSVPESNIYALEFNADNRVESRQLDFVNKAADANDTLRDVLGLHSASPIWVEKRIQEIIDKYSLGDMTAERLQEMREEFSALGIEKVFPAAVSEVWKS